MKIFRFLFVFLASYIVVACSNGNYTPPSTSETPPDSHHFGELSLEIEKNAKLRVKSLEIVKAIQNRQPVPFDTLSDEFLGEHAEAYRLDNLRDGTIEDWTHNLLQKFDLWTSSEEPLNITDFHHSAMTSLKELRKSDFIWDEDSVNLFDVFYSNQGSHSARVAFETILFRHMGAQKFHDSHFVVVYSDSSKVHLGSMRPANNTFELLVWSNSDPVAPPVNFGTTKDLRGPLHIIKADDYLVYELVKNFLSQPVAFKLHLLERAAARYQIPFKNIMPAEEALEIVEKDQHLEINESIFSIQTLNPSSKEISPETTTENNSKNATDKKTMKNNSLSEESPSHNALNILNTPTENRNKILQEYYDLSLINHLRQILNDPDAKILETSRVKKHIVNIIPTDSDEQNSLEYWNFILKGLDDRALETARLEAVQIKKKKNFSKITYPYNHGVKTPVDPNRKKAPESKFLGLETTGPYPVYEDLHSPEVTKTFNWTINFVKLPWTLIKKIPGVDKVPNLLTKEDKQNEKSGNSDIEKKESEQEPPNL